MPKTCKHNIPETLKGAGPCDIRSEVKKRNGNPHWWCHTHGLDASSPDGSALDRCSGSWFDAVSDEMRLEADLSEGEWAFWGALEPAIAIGTPPTEPGSVHVHHRPTSQAGKDIDQSFEIVDLIYMGETSVIEGMAAVAFSVSELAGVPTKPLECRRCGNRHIDEQKFAATPHRKHQCNQCGRAFFDGDGPSVSNPLGDLYEQLGVPLPPPPAPTSRSIELATADFSGIALWPSNSAILSTMSRPEDVGVHVHAWDPDGNQIIDDTYGSVVFDGNNIDQIALRALAVQKAVAYGVPITNDSCAGCGTSFISPRQGWIEPTTTHTCPGCGATVKTRRRSFLNPLARERERN